MLAYCDKIADTIKQALAAPDPDRILGSVGQVQWDLHPTGSYLVSTKKTLEVTDTNGKKYRVTVEEL